MSVRNYDAAVIGAGPAGSALAVRLASEGLRVALIDKAPLGRDRVCGGFLGAEAGAIFEKLGIPETLQAVKARPVHHLILSGPGTPEILAPLAGSGQPHGWGVNRQIFDQYLSEQAMQKGADFFPETTVEKSELCGGGTSLTLKSRAGETSSLKTRLLIRATGRRLPAVQNTRNFFACRAAYQGMSGMADRVVLHFVRGGHVGINQRSEGTTTLCLYVEQERIREAGGNLDRMMEQFSDENKAIRYHMRAASRVTDWQGCLAQPDRKTLFYDGTSFYAGDAVTMVNPIIGGGLAIAMGSSALLAEQILKEGRWKNGAERRIDQAYRAQWKKNYAARLTLGRFLGWCERSVRMTSWALRQFARHSALLDRTIVFSRPRLRMD